MKPAILALLLFTLALGCQEADANKSTKLRPGPPANPYVHADLPQAQAIVSNLKTFQLSDPPTAVELKTIESIAEGFLTYWDRESAACKHLEQEGIPLLLPHFDRLLPLASEADVGLKFDKLLAIFCLYQTPETLERFMHATRQDLPFTQWGEYFWEFQPGAPNYDAFWGSMLDSPPRHELNFQHLLSAANSHALDKTMPAHRHPFDSPNGIKHLYTCLQTSQTNPDEVTRGGWVINGKHPKPETARLATEALPFIKSQPINKLLELAQTHPSPAVRLEAAWAAAKLGKQSGLDELVRRTHELPLSLAAQDYLEDLGHSELIPEDCFNEAFQAQAFCAQELAALSFQPVKIESIEILGRDNFLWPLERMEVLLVSYRIHRSDGDKQRIIEDIGHVFNSRFYASSKPLSNFSDEFPGDQLMGYLPNDIYGFLICQRLSETHILGGDRALSEEYAEGETALPGPEHLPSGNGKLVGRVAIDTHLTGYPTVKAAIFETNYKDKPGWTVLEDGQTTFYAKEDFPETATAQRILQMHAGRSYLGITRRN